jgi:ABC-type multidrug transport system fused ATPase/permease subunit
MTFLLRFLYRNLAGRRALLVLAVGLTLAQVAADLAIAFPLKFIVDAAFPAAGYAPHDPSFPFSHTLISPFNRFGEKGPGEEYSVVGVIVFSTILLCVIGLFTALLSYAQLFLASFLGATVSNRIRVDLFDHLQRLSLEWHGRQRTGDLVQRLTSFVADIEKLVTDGLVDLLAGVLTLLGALVIMTIINWQFTVLTMIVVPGLFAVVVGYTKAIKAATKRAAKLTARVGDIATEDLGAITEVKAFTLERRESLNFRTFSARLFEAKFHAGTLQAEFTPIVLLLVTASTAAIIGIGTYVASGHTFTLGPLVVTAGSITLGAVTAFLTYLKALYQPMRDLAKLTNLASSASSAAERIQAALDAVPEVAEAPRPYRGPTKLRGDIRYSGVVFWYEENVPVLKGVDLHIPAGRKFALVGLSGSGKTTMVKLMPRFYDVQGGSVEVDGLDVREYPLPLLRSNIALVLQDSVLFEGLIRDNIAVGRPGATDEEIIQAARHAHIHDQIMEMPLGYAAPVREAGKNFSGGQRQRLAIARAILRDAPILILDEPTASLDVEAEGEVMHAIDKLIHGRTVVMISHRLTSLGQADEIVVLKDGEIAEHGSYYELKRRGGVFAYMLEEQSRYSAERVPAEAPAPARRGRVRDLAGHAAAASLQASRAHSRWVDLEAVGPEEGGTGDGAAGPTMSDLRRLRRKVRQDQG